jgi:hypothetical protein
MNPTTQSRLTLLERAAGRSGRDEAAVRAALTGYLQALDRAVPAPASLPLPVLFGDTLEHAFSLAANVVRPLGASRDIVRPPRVREAHAAANVAAWSEGSIQKRAFGAWKNARDAARAIARNTRWDLATGAFADGLGFARFASGSVDAELAHWLPTLAIDAQLAAVDFVAAAELDDGLDERFRSLHEPLFEAFCAGAFRFWLLPTAIVVAPRLLVEGLPRRAATGVALDLQRASAGSADLHPRIVGLDRALPGRPLRAPLDVRADVLVRRQQGRIGAPRAEHVRHQDIRDGEIVGSDERAAREPAVELREPHIGPSRERVVRSRAFGAVQPHEPVRQDRRLDAGERGKAPPQDLGFPGEITRHQLAALAREVDQNRARFRHHDAVVVDGGDLAKRVHRAEGVAREIAARMVQTDDFERQPHLFERPENT